MIKYPRQIVTYHEHGGAEALFYVGEDLIEGGNGSRIKGGDGLIQDKKLTTNQQRSGKQHASFLAA